MGDCSTARRQRRGLGVHSQDVHKTCAKSLYSPLLGSSWAIRSGSSSATRSDSSWETAGRASQHVKASEMSLHQALAATCKACKEIVLTSVGFFVGDSVGSFVRDCRWEIAARQGVSSEKRLTRCVQDIERDCTHLICTPEGDSEGSLCCLARILTYKSTIADKCRQQRICL